VPQEAEDSSEQHPKVRGWVCWCRGAPCQAVFWSDIPGGQQTYPLVMSFMVKQIVVGLRTWHKEEGRGRRGSCSGHTGMVSAHSSCMLRPCLKLEAQPRVGLDCLLGWPVCGAASVIPAHHHIFVNQAGLTEASSTGGL
jgi:hypothetical protein